ncbi:MAG: hypothetical protein FJ139_08125 [Deltaproteobacteria bacterium]|nr:hypothetical protein [Deltaproteobacteria bacterium]
MDTIDPETKRILTAKENRRHKLASLPYPEKVRAVVQLQRMAVPLLRNRNKRARIWQINGLEVSSKER